jgi:hypothetical protein
LQPTITLGDVVDLKIFRPELLPNLPDGRQVEILMMKIRTKS